jgi:hypothetical protein
MATENTNTIEVPIKLINTRNVMIGIGVAVVLVGLFVVFKPKADISKVVTNI